MTSCNTGYYKIHASDIESKLKRLNELDANGLGFECVMANLYCEQGYWILQGYCGDRERWGAYIKQYKQDGGIDIIIEKNGVKYAVQCKHYQRKNVESKDIQALLGAFNGQCKFVTTSDYTKNARDVAKRNSRIVLYNWNDIMLDFHKYFKV